MAKKRKAASANKSQAIRDYYAAHPRAKPKEVASELKKKGVQVSAAFVSTIRSTSKKKKGKIGRPGRPVGSGSSAKSKAKRSDTVSIDALVKIKQLVDDVGGIKEARKVLSALERIL